MRKLIGFTESNSTPLDVCSFSYFFCSALRDKDGFPSGRQELTTCLLLLEHIGMEGCWAAPVPTAPGENQWGRWQLHIMCRLWVWVCSALLPTWAQRLKTLWEGKKKIQTKEICRSWSPFEWKKKNPNPNKLPGCCADCRYLSESPTICQELQCPWIKP